MPDEVFVLLLIPVACISLGMTLHYAIKPFFEGILKAMREPRRVQASHEVDELRAEVQLLAETVETLNAKADFDRRLAAETARVEGNV